MNQEIKFKIVDLVSGYQYRVLHVKTEADALTATKATFEQIVSNLAPKTLIEYFEPGTAMPQDKEESKDLKMPFNQKIASHLSKLQATVNSRKQQISEQVIGCINQRNNLVETMKSLKQLTGSAEFDCNLQKAADQLSDKIKQLESETEGNSAFFLDIENKIEQQVQLAIEKISGKIAVIQIENVTVQVASFSHRNQAPFKPITGVQDQILPDQLSLSYDCYLTSIHCNPGVCFFNFTFSRFVTNFPTGTYAMQEIKINPVGRQIKRILTFYFTNDDPFLSGIYLFDKDGNEILKTPYDCRNRPSQETILAENERIVGFRSRKYKEQPAAHYDFQFVIGKIE